MPTERLRVAFLWHFHQPCYKDLLTEEYVMPWVRLHALKDYYDMGAILASVDGAAATFNFVGSLLSQLDDYASGRAKDLFQDLTAKPADALDRDEQRFLLTNFFYINRKIIDGYPRFSELLARRETALSARSASRVFNKADFLDLQVLFNLSWCGNTLRRENEVVKALHAKGRGFTEDEKLALLGAQQAFMSRIVPLYSRLASAGSIELTTTPFYHPILPVLANVQNARECEPGVPLPAKWVGVMEDAKRQAGDAAELFAARYGVPLRGMWPAEGSVSQDTCGIYTDLGVKWIATDEVVLSNSLSACGMQNLRENRSQLYSPHFVEANGKKLTVFFRDHALSDAIGFVYAPWDVDDAVSDFIARLRGIRDVAGGRNDTQIDRIPAIVSVILDGENAWQYYADNGEPFLRSLYTRLVKTDWVELVTFGDYVEQFGAGRRLCRLAAGSWIGGDFAVWIGHSEDNQAWDYVAAAREALVKNPPSEQKARELAWQSLFAAEGSDWNWWYGDDHACDNIEQFDRLFRKHIANVFALIGRDPPFDLSVPIKKASSALRVRQPKQLLRPVIDGKDTTYFEWLGAGVFDQRSAGRGAMHQVSTLVQRLYFGFDLKNLFIRVDFAQDAAQLLGSGTDRELFVQVSEPSQYRLKIVTNRSGRDIIASIDVLSQKNGEWQPVASLDSVAVGRVLEMAIPFQILGCKPHDKIRFAVKVTKNGDVIETIPEGSSIEAIVPGPDFEQEEWCV